MCVYVCACMCVCGWVCGCVGVCGCVHGVLMCVFVHVYFCEMSAYINVHSFHAVIDILSEYIYLLAFHRALLHHLE